MAKKKTALVVCRCGNNISNFIDTAALEDWAKELDGVVVKSGHNLLCSPDGKKHFKEQLKQHDVERVVIAACSPKMHERTFQDAAEEVGFNLSHVQMVNIREQCAWVTKEKNEATEKAKALVNAIIERSQFAEPLQKRSMAVNTDLLIIGGGIAGIEAALMAAKADRKVYIVEKEVSLGGTVIKMEELAPEMECAPCLLAPRLSAIRENPNITVIANAEVVEVKGFYGNFVVTVNKRARYIEPSCIGCEACFEVCPVDVQSKFHMGLGTHKAVYTSFPGSLPAAAAVAREHCLHFKDGSCNDACVAACAFDAFNFDQKDERMAIEAGAIILATGLKEDYPSHLKQFGLGVIDDVYTMLEFERIAASNGPYGSNIRRKNGEKPNSVAVIHCAGSLRENGELGCSRVCCFTALKVGDLVRKKDPDARVYNIHNGLVLPTPKEQAFFAHQKQAGTSFIRCADLGSIQVAREGGSIRVSGPGFEPLTVDMVVLATGLRPHDDTPRLTELLNLERSADGFFKSDHSFLNAIGSSIDGIYVVGALHSPCDVSEAVIRTKAAVGDALSKLMPGREIALEIMTSSIDSAICAGCKLCISVCPYKAITYDKENKVCHVNEVICRGCGTCTASCPSGASTAKHFTDQEMRAEVKGVLNG
jgi:heterodisulfide reductase subunit A